MAIVPIDQLAKSIDEPHIVPRCARPFRVIRFITTNQHEEERGQQDFGGHYVSDSFGFDFALQSSETAMKLQRLVRIALQRNSSRLRPQLTEFREPGVDLLEICGLDREDP